MVTATLINPYEREELARRVLESLGLEKNSENVRLVTDTVVDFYLYRGVDLRRFHR